MPNETDLLNDALSLIGAAKVASIDDGTVNANYCKVFYPTLRDGLIRSHHWNWALQRAELAQDAVAPAFEFAFSYTLPPDLLKVVQYNGASTDTSRLPLFDHPIRAMYKIEGRKLVTNDGQVKIVYLARITNPDQWDAIFYQVLITWLASKLAMAIPKDTRLSSTLLNQAVGILMPLAAAVDGQEGSTEPFYTDDLLWGR